MPFYRVIHCNRMQLCLHCTFSLCRIDLQQLQDCTEETIPFPTTKPKKARPETPKRSTPEQSFTDVPTPTHPQTPLVASCNISYQEKKGAKWTLQKFAARNEMAWYKNQFIVKSSGWSQSSEWKINKQHMQGLDMAHC